MLEEAGIKILQEYLKIVHDNLNDLPTNVIPYVRKGIDNYLNNKPFSIYGW